MEQEQQSPSTPNWQWPSDATFPTTGKTFQDLYNFTNTYLNQSKAQEVLAVLHLHEQLSDMFRKGIAEGTITDGNQTQPIPKEEES